MAGGQASVREGPAMKLQESEREALQNSAVLLKFVAESPKTAPDDVITPLLAAWQAEEKNEWSPAIATAFWVAYSKLCDLIKPVSMNTISMCQIPPAAEGKKPGRSPAQIHARRYLILMLFLAICAVGFGYVAGSTTKLSDDIANLVKEGNQFAPQITSEVMDIKAELEALDTGANALQLNLDDKRITEQTRKKIADLRAKLQSLYWVCDQLNSKVIAIGRITGFKPIKGYIKGDLSRLPVLDNGFDNVRNYYQWRREVAESQQNVALLNWGYNALVPLLLGAVGATTYVVRLISDQIRDTTFASSSPIRHVARVALGSLAGIAVGLGGFNNEFNLPSAAFSFLAGYAIEPVFSTLDGIAEKFRRT